MPILDPGGGDTIQVTPATLEAIASDFHKAAADEEHLLKNLERSGMNLHESMINLFGPQSKSAASFNFLWGLWINAMLALNNTEDTMGNLLAWASQHYDTHEQVTVDQFRPGNMPLT